MPGTNRAPVNADAAGILGFFLAVPKHIDSVFGPVAARTESNHVHKIRIVGQSVQVTENVKNQYVASTPNLDVNKTAERVKTGTKKEKVINHKTGSKPEEKIADKKEEMQKCP